MSDRPSLERLATTLQVTLRPLTYRRRLRPNGKPFHHAREDAELCASVLLDLLKFAIL